MNSQIMNEIREYIHGEIDREPLDLLRRVLHGAQQEAEPVACDAAAIERALRARAWIEDGALWPDAYSEDEQTGERESMLAAFEAANQKHGPRAYCRTCQSANMQNCQHFNECDGATCITCHRPINTAPQPRIDLWQFREAVEFAHECAVERKLASLKARDPKASRERWALKRDEYARLLALIDAQENCK